MKNNEISKLLLQVDSSFTDYTKFEVENQQREEQKRLFINGDIYSPSYHYIELSSLYDTKTDNYTGKKSIISAKKMAIQYAVMELDSLSKSGDINEDLAELYASYYEKSLKKIILVEAARDLILNQGSSNQENLRRSFVEINKELYGEIDEKDYRSILLTEYRRLNKFIDPDKYTQEIIEYLRNYLENISVNTVPTEEHEILNKDLIDSMYPIIKDRYSYIWKAVPETDDSTYYNAEESNQIINLALYESGLSKSGWVSVVSDYKKSPSTSSDSKTVSLPASTSRNSKQLRALIIHEVGVHAQRAQNGENTGLQILKTGTASYADIEEGLGVLLECIVNNSVDNPALHRARDRYLAAGLALGGQNSRPKDARQTYEILWRLIASRKSDGHNITEEAVLQAKNEAYDHIENAFRGTNFTTPGVIYSKLKIYREGLKKNIQYFQDVSDISLGLDRALRGKYNHTDINEVKIIETLVQGIDKNN